MPEVALVLPPGFGDTSPPSPVPILSSANPSANVESHFATGDASPWSSSRSANLYQINAWGAPYFTANASGNISIRPHGEHTLPYQEIDLMKILKKSSDGKPSGGLGLHLPLIVRLPDVLKHRLESLHFAFESSIKSQSYNSRYQGVYPVKCNQDRFIVDDIVKFGAPFRFGLEAGSKPELLLAMSSLCHANPESLLICNGFKDAEYISLSLIARKLGLNTVIVLEQEEEVNLMIDLSLALDVLPVVGLRAKLRTKHAGHFGSTSGEKGKFGLTTSQILRVVKKMQQAGMLECLQLLHFHIGSQIPTTGLLSDGVSEAAQIYCELVRLGAKMKVLDIGGGLGIDYDGSKSSDSDVSVAYDFNEYAAAVVESVKTVCDGKFVEHPILCSESGRAIVSHHSILIFEAVSMSETPVAPVDLATFTDGLVGEAVCDYQNLKAAAGVGDYEGCIAAADSLKQRCVEQFKQGVLSMEMLAAADALCEVVDVGSVPSVRTYEVNLSVFTSVPDFWGIGQVFPIVPIHRLNEQPLYRGVLSDLTCDSDGKIDRFISGEGSLPLHAVEGRESGYYLGMFLGGAYEEALGGLHNLFGSPGVVRVCASDGPTGFCVTGAASGPSCSDVLRAMRHEPELMFEALKHRAVDGSVDGKAGSVVDLDALACSFHGSPYLVSASSSCCFVASAGRCCCYGNEHLSDAAAADDDQWSYCCA